ncbi:uncharacterized protein LOC141590703 [Silene latifolia]|uniref:uncharacterized protein LOC141590703 n=1 Tax=Silene latifolia TaxID=37657 RepID=UPI003D7793D2
MAKAYDRVEWVFLESVLHSMGFARTWIENVMRCVETVSYEVLINGDTSSSFVPKRGIRQGDPLSPYLFILCAEVLSSSIRRAVERGALHEIRITPEAPVVSHLLFADDSIIFVKANEREAHTVLGILHDYERASGQLVSKDKTTVSFSKGTSLRRKEKVEEILGVRRVNEQERYLGLPTVIGHSKQVLNKIIRDKLNNKLQGWRGMLFSRAGREVLIKAVAQSIPTYAMSVFKLPVNFCDELRSIVSKFWWGSNNGKRKISWVAWDTMCRSKSRGGLGFRDFMLFNKALLAKQSWRMICEDGSLMVRIMKAKYFLNCSFMDANLGANPSYTWRSIHETKMVMALGIRRQLGNDLTTGVWVDPWIPGTSSRKVISPRRDFDINMKVADLFVEDEVRWDREKVRAMFLPFEADRILNIRLSKEPTEDGWCWDNERDGSYTVKSGYRLLCEEGSSGVEQADFSQERWVWNAVWSAPVLPRIKNFMWQLCHEAIPTKSLLATRLGSGDGLCPRCFGDMETCLHVVRDCGWGDGVWEEMGIEVDRTIGVVRVREWVEGMLRERGVRERREFMVTCWVLWEKRDKVVFEEARWETERIVRRIRELVWEMESSEAGQGVEESLGGGGGGWRQPGTGEWKVNVDAGIMEGVGVGLGAVCRNEEGSIEWAAAFQQVEERVVDVAEAEAVLFGLREARRMGRTKIIIESDCLSVINDLKKRKKGRSILFSVYDDIYKLCVFFDSVVFLHARRNCNRVAHFLAHYRPWSLGRRVWTDNFPAELGDVASLDLSNMN